MAYVSPTSNYDRATTREVEKVQDTHEELRLISLRLDELIGRLPDDDTRNRALNCHTALKKVVYGGKEPFIEKVARMPRYVGYGLLSSRSALICI